MTTSLSSIIQKAMIQSSYFVTSRYELYTDERFNGLNNENDFITRLKKKSMMKYHLQNTSSTILRVITNIAIVALISPIGVIWHAGHAIYSVKNKEVRAQHLTCCNKELIKVAATLACVFILAIAPLTPLYNVSLINLIIKYDVAQIVAAMIVTYGGLSFGFDLYNTLFNPLFNSRQLGPSTDIHFTAQMALKWELGIQCNESEAVKLLDTMIEESAKRILSAIESLQNKLSLKHRLPFDKEVNITRILQYLEQSRPELIKENEWTSIETDRHHLITFDRLLSKLQSYRIRKFFPLSEECIKSSFTCQGVIPLLEKRASPELHIHSLTQTLFKKMLVSNWFYPSNYQLQPAIKDRGSIALSMHGIDPFENRLKITHCSHQKLKPVRYLARALGSVMILTMGVPIGTVYNGIMTTYHLSMHPFMHASYRFGNWQKIKAYAFATYNDLTTALSGSGTILPVLNDRDGVTSIATRADRAGLFKTITLKNDFGITGPQGQLLTYSYTDDIPSYCYYDALFMQLFNDQSLKLFYMLDSLYGKLPGELKEQMNNNFSYFCMGGFAGKLLFFLKHHLPNEIKTINKCNETFSNLSELKIIMRNAIQKTEGRWPSDNLIFEQPKIHFGHVFNGFSGQSIGQRPKDPWDNFISIAQLTLTQPLVINPSIKETEKIEKYKELYHAIFVPGITAKQLFGFGENDPLSHKLINKRFNEMSIYAHPDKSYHAKEADGNEIYTLLSNARKILLAKAD